MGSFLKRFFVVFLRCVPKCAFGAKKGNDTSKRSDFGVPGEGKGRGKPPPQSQKVAKCYVLFFCCCLLCFFVALLRQPALDARPRAGGFVLHIPSRFRRLRDHMQHRGRQRDRRLGRLRRCARMSAQCRWTHKRIVYQRPHRCLPRTG